ncbi:MAG: hypothetical protein ACRC7N_16575 [Clostridium sp.]
MNNNKENIFFVVALTFIFILCVFVGIYTRNSFIDDVSDGRLEYYSSDLRFFMTSSLESGSKREKITDVDELSNEADLILKVKITENKEYKAYSFLTECNVVEIYSNKRNLELKEKIYIYDPSWYSVPHKSYMAMEGYNFLKKGDEYLVFLNTIEVPDGYKLSNKEMSTFNLTNTKISRFNLQEDDNVILLETDNLDKGIKYTELNEYERIFDSRADMESYLSIKKYVKNKYLDEGKKNE